MADIVQLLFKKEGVTMATKPSDLLIRLSISFLHSTPQFNVILSIYITQSSPRTCDRTVSNASRRLDTFLRGGLSSRRA